MGVPGWAAGGGTRPRHPPHLLLQGVVATVTGIQRPLLLLHRPGALLQHRHSRLGEWWGGSPQNRALGGPKVGRSPKEPGSTPL